MTSWDFLWTYSWLTCLPNFMSLVPNSFRCLILLEIETCDQNGRHSVYHPTWLLETFLPLKFQKDGALILVVTTVAAPCAVVVRMCAQSRVSVLWPHRRHFSKWERPAASRPKSHETSFFFIHIDCQLWPQAKEKVDDVHATCSARSWLDMWQMWHMANTWRDSHDRWHRNTFLFISKIIQMEKKISVKGQLWNLSHATKP